MKKLAGVRLKDATTRVPMAGGIEHLSLLEVMRELQALRRGLHQ